MTVLLGKMLSKALQPPRAKKSTIPIFPLRKRTLLPTERIVLNLYEERYLLLAERFLEADSCLLLGAVPSTGKPQIIARGSGPIVPLFEPGDTGVICKVEKAEESQIPTFGGTSRRRIRLECQATGRLELTKIISRGTMILNLERTSKSEKLPYITAEYRLLRSGERSVLSRKSRGSDVGRDQNSANEKENSERTSEEGAFDTTEFLAFEAYLANRVGALSKLDRLALLQTGIPIVSK